MLLVIRSSGKFLSGYEVTATSPLGTELLLVVVELRLLVLMEVLIMERLLASLRKSLAVTIGMGREAIAISDSEQIGSLVLEEEEDMDF